MGGEKRLRKQGAYFFVLDAFIAGIIIVSSLAIFFSTLVVSDNPSQNYVLAEDFLLFLEQTSVSSYGGISKYEMRSLINDSTISLLELIVSLNVSSTGPGDTYSGNMTRLLQEVSLLAPENNGLAYYLDGGLLYNTTSSGLAIDDSRLRLSSQRIVVLRADKDLDVHTLEVRMWR